EPLAPALVLPEALDDAQWLHGFAAGWADVDNAYVYSYTAFVDLMVKVNRNVVPEAELSRLEQLWAPRWEGKIAMYGPRVQGAGFTAGTGSIGLFSQAPHPNAAKVYANWFLTQEAQALYAQTTGFNSRRLDVPVADPDYVPDPKKDYLNIDIEVNYDARDKAV